MTSDYMRTTFDAGVREEFVSTAIRDLKDVEFEAIAVRGVSGLLIGPIVAYQMRKAILVVRKEGEYSHAESKVEGPDVDTYIILDDFISTGATVREIIRKIEEDRPFTKCVGIYTYKVRNSSEKRFRVKEGFEIPRL